MHYKIRCFNKISEHGLSFFKKYDCEVGDDVANPQGLLLRSHHLNNTDIASSVLAIARAGAGVNNIDVNWCTAKGIAVFNTPGANANAVKELVLAALLLCSRDILQAANYVQSLTDINDNAELNKKIESEKKQFKGVDLAGRTLGVVGLGAVGARVADMALNLGMRVIGYDPALSVDSAWRLSRQIERCENLTQLARSSEYISLHIPAVTATLSLVNKKFLAECKKNLCLLNFSRAEIVDTADIVTALNDGTLKAYVADFPHPDLLKQPNAILLPHIGASTVGAEENCALMAAEQLYNFLATGNVVNSVNYPALYLEQKSTYRVAVSNINAPKMLNSILAILGNADINVIDLLNKSRDNIAYNVIDIDASPGEECLDNIKSLDGISGARVIKNET